MVGSGKESAAQLFQRHGATVYRRCLALLRHEDQARDAVQDVWLRSVAQRGRFRGQSSALTWLYSIATRHCLQQLRNHGRQTEKLGALPPDQPAAVGLE